MSLLRTMERKRAQRLTRQAKRAASKVRWPKDFKGGIMWCPLCYGELRRVPDGEEAPSADEQQRIADEHRATCKRYALKAV